MIFVENVTAMVGYASIAYDYRSENRRNIHFSGKRSSPAVVIASRILKWRGSVRVNLYVESEGEVNGLRAFIGKDKS